MRYVALPPVCSRAVVRTVSLFLRTPSSQVFRGSILDGYLEVGPGAVGFLAMDVVRWGGRWFGATHGDIHARRALVEGVSAPPAEGTLGIGLLACHAGAHYPARPDMHAIVYAQGPRGAYRAHLLVAPMLALAEDQASACGHA